MKLLGIAGSLREDSYNESVLRAAQRLVPPPCELRVFPLDEIPLYDADVEAQGTPQPVQELKQAIHECDAVLIATPEYNHGIPGVLKNALDWASRPGGRSPLKGKAVAIITAVPGMTGGARALPQTREALIAVGAHVLPQPEVLIARVHEKIDESGELTDEETARWLSALMQELAELSARLES
jgi:chromate reductase